MVVLELQFEPSLQIQWTMQEKKPGYEQHTIATMNNPEWEQTTRDHFHDKRCRPDNEVYKDVGDSPHHGISINETFGEM